MTGIRGWDESSRQAVDVVPIGATEQDEALDDDPLTYMKYAQTLAAHSREARMAAEYLVKALSNLGLDAWSAELIFATHHHDLGKAHPIFQSTLQGLPPDAASPDTMAGKINA